MIPGSLDRAKSRTGNKSLGFPKLLEHEAPAQGGSGYLFLLPSWDDGMKLAAN